jgi:predicted nuclease with TOPRIM domain
MDSILSLIIPALVGGFFTYLIAIHRHNSKKASMLAEIQDNAIKTVQLIEERIRADLRKELDQFKEENKRLHQEVAELRGKLTISSDLITTLKDEIVALRSTLSLYKDEMARSKQRLSSLENGNGNGNSHT